MTDAGGDSYGQSVKSWYAEHCWTCCEPYTDGDRHPQCVGKLGAGQLAEFATTPDELAKIAEWEANYLADRGQAEWPRLWRYPFGG